MTPFIPESIKSIIKDKSYTLDEIGMSGSTILNFEDMVLKIEEDTSEAENTVEMLKWLKGKLPVPEIICYEVHENISYLLMSRIEGEMSCEEYYLDQPDLLASLLAEGLKMLWSVDIGDCPCDNMLEHKLELAQEIIDNDGVDIENTEPGTFGEGGFESPQALLDWLKENKPEEEPVLSHGDYCLPNIFLKDNKVNGFIDLGRSGISDKWLDIALGYRSLVHNFDGSYGGKVYEGFNPEILFEKLGIEPEWDKIRYYILLDELF